MILHIQRYRWIVVRDGKDIFCGLAREYEFKAIDNIGDTAIKTYRSRNIAEISFRRSWWHADELIEAGRIEFVKVVEQVCTVGFHEWLNEVKKHESC